MNLTPNNYHIFVVKKAPNINIGIGMDKIYKLLTTKQLDTD